MPYFKYIFSHLKLLIGLMVVKFCNSNLTILKDKAKSVPPFKR